MPLSTIKFVPSSSFTTKGVLKWRQSFSSSFIFSKFKYLNMFLKHNLTLSPIRPHLVKCLSSTNLHFSKDVCKGLLFIWLHDWSNNGIRVYDVGDSSSFFSTIESKFIFPTQNSIDQGQTKGLVAISNNNLKLDITQKAIISVWFTPQSKTGKASTQIPPKEWRNT